MLMYVFDFRSFSTTARDKVYVEHPLTTRPDRKTRYVLALSQEQNDYLERQRLDNSVIIARSHPFDIPIQGADFDADDEKVLRSALISNLYDPAKHAEGVRQFHRNNEEKLLAHVRQRISDREIMNAVSETIL